MRAQSCTRRGGRRPCAIHRRCGSGQPTAYHIYPSLSLTHFHPLPFLSLSQTRSYPLASAPIPILIPNTLHQSVLIPFHIPNPLSSNPISICIPNPLPSAGIPIFIHNPLPHLALSAPNSLHTSTFPHLTLSTLCPIQMAECSSGFS